MAALFRKELIQFLRDRLMLFLILFLYTAEVLMCTFALSFDVRNLPTAVADFDRSADSRRLIDGFGASGYFSIEHRTTREAELAGLLDRGEALAALVIPPEFSRRQAAGETAAVQLLLDGANANTAAVAEGYAQRIVQDYALERLRRTAGQLPAAPVENRPRIWYNSELRYAYFMVLSMIGVAGMLVGVITTAAGIVREKESGTMEQLRVTPVRPGEMFAAKMLPTLLVGLAALFPGLLIAAGVGVPLRGSLALFFLFSAVFLVSSMGIGILVATFADTLQQALLMAFFALFPILFLSGTLVPVESMPWLLQYLAELSPLTHYMEALLGIFLKGVGLDVLWPRLAAMLAIGGVLLALSVWRFRRHLG
ncbi:MAG: ABC transporter permease [Thiobacillus sp.]|uniref:ABC transporter permease n=1 Tax=Thiobacillus sp. TaxID=924 RepID=UPI0028947110|nr:ABC transporter permease [Thiobacillus sp.]MDT3706225.1 ABC transporter permease [Thiobacillus sp.]